MSQDLLCPKKSKKKCTKWPIIIYCVLCYMVVLSVNLNHLKIGKECSLKSFISEHVVWRGSEIGTAFLQK